MPSSPPDRAPLLRFTLADGRPATLLLGDASTVLSIDDTRVSSWDLAGRPYALVRETGTYRRGLDGGLLWKREATAEGARRRRRLSAAEGEPVVDAARQEALAALEFCQSEVTSRPSPVAVSGAPVTPRDSGGTALVIPSPDPRGTRVALGNDPSCRALPKDASGSASAPREGLGEGLFMSRDSGGTALVIPRDSGGTGPEESAGIADPSSPGTNGAPREDTVEAVLRLRQVVTMDARALRDDAARFLAASGPVGVLPPDQYLALVVRVTEGCSWNACTFCSLYRDVRFRWKRPDELLAHLAALGEYFGPSIALRRSVFLGDANALCLAHDRLLPLVEAVAVRFPGMPLYSFLDAWTGQRRSPSEWRDYAALGLKRVYVGLETGDAGLLAWLEKPGSPQDAVDLVGALHEAGIGAGVIVLLGAGGERFAEAHAAHTAEVLTSMRLGPGDMVYFSEYVDDPGLAYGQRAAGAEDLRPLPPERGADQRRAIIDGIRRAPGARPPRHATYDIREFVY